MVRRVTALWPVVMHRCVYLTLAKASQEHGVQFGSTLVCLAAATLAHSLSSSVVFKVKPAAVTSCFGHN